MQPKLRHTLLASKRCLIDFQQVLSWGVTDALLKSHQAPLTNDWITNWLTAGCRPAFCTCLPYLQMIYLESCNDFSKPYLSFHRMKTKRLCIGGWQQNRRLQSWQCLCLMNDFGSSVEAIRKASTHWTEEHIIRHTEKRRKQRKNITAVPTTQKNDREAMHGFPLFSG